MSKKQKFLVIFALLGCISCLLGQVVMGYQDWLLRSAPGGNPASGYLRMWADSGSNLFKCLTSSGATCYFDTAATSPVFETNSVNNSTQTGLNLVASTNITLTNTTGNTVTIAASGGGGGGGLTQIAQQVLGSAASTVTFSSIPSSYSNLRLVVTAQNSTSFNIVAYIQFNGDTGSNYQGQFLQGGTGTSTSAGYTSATSQTSVFWAASTNLTYPAQSVIEIPQYAATTFKKTLVTTEATFNGNSTDPLIYSRMVAWNSTAAINSITIGLVSTGNFVAGSAFTLYGEQ